MRRTSLMTAGLAASLLLSACGGGGTPAATSTAPVDQPDLVITPEPEPDVTSPRIALPSEYAELSKRAWQKLVKNPDAYLGKGYKVWACIWQFDAATGDDGFLGYASYRREDYWALDGDNAAFVGAAAQLEDFVEGDIVAMSVMAVGSYSYDTQAGGNTTVPSFQVVKIKRQKGSCE